MSQILLNQEVLTIVLRQQSGLWHGFVNGRSYHLSWQHLLNHKIKLILDGSESVITAVSHDGVYYLHGYGRSWTAKIHNPLLNAGAGTDSNANTAVAPMPGTVVSVEVKEGDAVAKGSLLLTIESMKMLTDISASRDGVVEEVHLSEGDTFDKGARLVSLV